ncbi:hypothetical protein PACTADRAFT_24971, partial [Pachysolen tannophilus NRRL Y-2460]
RLATTQLVIAIVLGLFLTMTFCIMRLKFPDIYMSRFNHYNRYGSSLKKILPPQLPRTIFSWFGVLYGIDENKILNCCGLDAYVFLGFFKMSIKLLFIFTVLGFTVISPVRYYFTGRYDQDRDDDDDEFLFTAKDDNYTNPDEYEPYLWTYVVFTYLFTFIAQYILAKQSNKFIKVRQAYLGNQNSITDRTIRISGIPPSLRDEKILKNHIESLNIGKVESIVICREWKNLNWLFKERMRIVENLEKFWSEYLANDNICDLVNIRSTIPDTYRLDANTYHDEENRFQDNEEEEEDQNREESNSRSFMNQDTRSIMENGGADEVTSSLISITSNSTRKRRPTIQVGGLFNFLGKKVDAIDYYTKQLQTLDQNIIEARTLHYSPTPSAFVTMKSVANAQLVAQSVLDPEINHCITRLAPSPNDIIWENVCLPSKERYFKVYYITVAIGIISVISIVPVSYLAAFLNTKSISKIWPSLGKFLKTHEWAKNIVSVILPPYLFTLLNVIVPYFYVWLSSKQGFVSHSEEELSIVSKNFFYIFVNLFLIFTLAGTFSNFWSYLSDTTKIAYQLANSLKKLSLFYVDLIILQGIGFMPFKLLLVSQLLKFPFLKKNCKTPRHYQNLYKPPSFNFGLQLPQPILILIITIIYSVMSTKILACGLIYFIIGYYVFKFQLIYSCIHPQHSTGKVWATIFRRLVLGLLIFQLTMVGTLALQKAYLLASLLTPLPVLTLWFLIDFQRHYLPLNNFIALTAIKDHFNRNSRSGSSNGNYGSEAQNGVPSIRTSTSSSLDITGNPTKTIDERRELNQTYDFPNMIKSLDGPWLMIDKEDIIM